MANDEASILIVVVIAVVSLAGIALAATAFSTNHSFGSMMGPGGMMNQTPTGTNPGPGVLEWSVLILSAVFLAVAVVLWLGARATRRPPMTTSAPVPLAGPTMAPRTVPEATGPSAQAAEALAEPTLVRLLDADERQMYLEIRDHGGTMLQRDLVALGVWSKAKVTRVLDKLEAKGVVVREAHGMTNRVRIVQAAK